MWDGRVRREGEVEERDERRGERGKCVYLLKCTPQCYSIKESMGKGENGE